MAALVAALGWFVVRGVVRGLDRSTDWKIVYAAARTWVYGGNPYRREELSATWQKAQAPREPELLIDRPSLYPAATFAVLGPLARIRWRAGPWGALPWLTVNVASTLCVAFMLTRRAGHACTSAKGLLLSAVTLAFAPVISAVSLGQLSLPCLALVLGSRAGWAGRHPIHAGLLLGIACALKPQNAGLFLLLDLARGHWRRAAGAIVCAAAFGLLGFGWLLHNDRFALADWRSNLQVAAEQGNTNANLENPARHELVNLAVATEPLLSDHVGIAVAGSMVTICLAGACRDRATSVRQACGGDRQCSAARQEAEQGLFWDALIATATLLPVYHRAYDAVLLLVPLAWSMRAAPGPGRLQAVPTGARRVELAVRLLTAASCLAFLVPGPALLVAWRPPAAEPAFLSASWWYAFVAVPHQAWAVALTAVVLTAAIVDPCRGAGKASSPKEA